MLQPCRKLFIDPNIRKYSVRGIRTNMTIGEILLRPQSKIRNSSRNRLLMLFITALAAIAVACGGGDASSVQLDDGQQLASVKTGDLAKEIPVDGALVFPNVATMKFESSGVVGTVNVVEGASVKAGDVLVTFDILRMARLEKSLADARVTVSLAESNLNILRLPSPGLVLQAHAAKAKAAVAADVAADRYHDLVNPQELQLSTAENAVAQALIELDDAEEDFDDLKSGQFPDAIVRDGRNAFTFAQTGLDAAQRTLDDSNMEWDNKLRFAQEGADDALDSRLDLYKFWLGIDLRESEIPQDPQDLFVAWGLDLDENFDRTNPVYATGFNPPEEDPVTRWKEFTIWAWLNLYPGYRSIRGTCADNLVLGSSERCIEREFDAEFDLFDSANDTLITVRDGASKAIDGAQDALIAAQDKFLDARDDFDDIADGPEPGELLDAASRVGLAKAALENAEGDLEEVILNVGPEDAARAQIALDAARERIEEPTNGEDRVRENALDIELAMAEMVLADSQLKAAQIQLRGAANVHAQQLAAAEAAFDAAQEIVVNLEEDLEGGSLRAPFDGIVALLDVDVEDFVNDESRIAEIVDTSVVEVRGVVDASNIGLFQEGAQARVTFHDLQERTFSGVVSFVSKDPRTERGVVSFAVIVRVDVPAGLDIPVTLTPISTVIVTEQTGVLLVPRDAIAVDKPGSTTTVNVVRNGAVVVQDVVTGESYDGWTVIRSGLESGEEVVVTGLATSTSRLTSDEVSGLG